MQFTIICKECGKTSIVRSPKALFCSIACKTKWQNSHRKRFSDIAATKECEVCGKRFKPFHSADRFCSKECRQIFVSVNRNVQNVLRNRKRIGDSRKCAFCGKEFVPRMERHICCSAACYQSLTIVNRIRAKAATTAEAEHRINEVLEYISKPKECPVCGKSFVPRNIRQTCCSKACGIVYRSEKYKQKALMAKPEKACVFCGRTFHAKRPNQKCCSRECRREYGLKVWRESRYKENRLRLKETTRVCKECGNTYTPTRANQVCCSTECSKVHELKAVRSRWESYKNKKRKVLEQKSCAECGRLYVPRNRRQKFCSPECYVDAKFSKWQPKPRTRQPIDDSKKESAIDFALQVTAQRNQNLDEFERVSLLSEQERIRLMETWGGEKKSEYYRRYGKRKPNTRFSITEMSRRSHCHPKGDGGFGCPVALDEAHGTTK